MKAGIGGSGCSLLRNACGHVCYIWMQRAPLDGMAAFSGTELCGTAYLGKFIKMQDNVSHSAAQRAAEGSCLGAHKALGTIADAAWIL